METKICTKCRIERPINCFYVENKKTGKRRAYCIECWKLYQHEHREHYIDLHKQYYQAHKQYFSEQSRLYHLNNQEKVFDIQKNYRIKNKAKINIKNQKRDAIKRKLISSMTVSQWEKIKMSFNNCCAYCGNNAELTQDHFIPLSHEGEYTINNIIPACKSCNSSKSNNDFFEWYPSKPFYSKRRELNILKFLHYDKNQNQQLKIG